MLDLPKAIAAYFALEPGSSTVLLDGIFAADAIVHDEKEDHRGLATIKAWRKDVMERTPSTARPLSIEHRGERIIVPAEVSGAFPEAP